MQLCMRVPGWDVNPVYDAWWQDARHVGRQAGTADMGKDLVCL